MIGSPIVKKLNFSLANARAPVTIRPVWNRRRRSPSTHAPWRRGAPIAVLACVGAGANALAQTDIANPSGALRERPQSGGLQLPGLQPAPLPPANLGLPAPPSAVAAPPIASSQRFILRKVDVVGNTVIDEGSIHAVVAPYIGKAVTTADLEEIRRRF